MQRWIGGVGAVLVLGAAYWAWPLVAAAQFASTIRQGNPADIAAGIDMPALRHSLARQIARAYLDASGKADKLGSFGRSMAGAAVTTVADPYLAEFLTPENISTLFSQGHVNQVKLGDRTVAIKSDLPKVSNLFDGNALSLVTGSYFDAVTDFVIPIDDGQNPQDQYRVHMHLDGLTWKLSGLELPPPIVQEMARSLMKGDGQAGL